MRDVPSLFDRHVCSTQPTPILGDGRKMWPTPDTDILKTRIAERAYQLSRIRGDDRSQSLATWLEAAKEILSESNEATTQ